MGAQRRAVKSCNSKQSAACNTAEECIAQIAHRIKDCRVRLGLTRRLLSVHSGISERYLSQIEAGKANISVALLWRITQAMDVDMHEVLPTSSIRGELSSPLFRLIKNLSPKQQDQAAGLLEAHLSPVPRSRGVALIGLRGAGKSELGNLLGDHSGVPFVDLVQVIEQLSGMEVGELFALGGQSAYRRFEQQALDHVLKSYNKAIVETGGSLVMQHDTYHKLLARYHTVWIKASADEHMQRVIAQGDLRPMRGNARAAMGDLKRILAERQKEYQAAHFTLDTTGRSVHSCLSELVQETSSYLH